MQLEPMPLPLEHECGCGRNNQVAYLLVLDGAHVVGLAGFTVCQSCQSLQVQVSSPYRKQIRKVESVALSWMREIWPQVDPDKVRRTVNVQSSH